jgi:hypothetical protein
MGSQRHRRIRCAEAGPVSSEPAADTGPDAPPERTEWRMQGGSVVVTLLPALGLALSTAVQVGTVLGEEVGLRRWVFLWMTLAVSVSGAVVFGTLCLRTRVRLVAAGVEVRQFRTVLHRYGDITDARVDRANNDRSIKLTLRHGTARTLPAPTQWLRRDSDPTLDDAVSAIRRRSGLTPTRLRRLP